MIKKITLSLMVLVVLCFSLSVSLIAQTLTPKEQLGKELYFDKIASPDRMACADCHGPSVGFTGPVSGFNKHGAVYPGAIPQRFGNRKPPTASYATFSPILHIDDGLFVGGNFWDGRATGMVLGSPAAEQALGPFLNPVEQNNPSKLAVLEQVAASKYAWMWEVAWGVPLSFTTQAEIDMNYDRIGLSIAAYEGSPEVNPFTSKYDYYKQGLVSLTPQEAWGEELFEGEKAMCSACHTSGEGALFTDFTFDNLGVPKNPENPFYEMDKVFLDNGTPINPLGASWIDYGLGGFLQTLPVTDPWHAYAAENMGKHKVPTLRNVDKRPGNGFVKAYMHNGVFKSLKEVVHFYNTRDVETWPPPEVSDNMNTSELGDLGLTDEEEDAIVAFMQTLSDGYKLPKEAPAGIAETTPSADMWILNQQTSDPSIVFSLPGDQSVRLEMFDLTGRRITTLANGFMPQGEHTLLLSRSGYPDGIYLLSLATGESRIVKKVSLVR